MISNLSPCGKGAYHPGVNHLKFIETYFMDWICIVFVNVSHGLREYVCFVLVGSSVLEMSIRSNWLIMFFKSSILSYFMYTFLSILKRRIFKSMTVIVDFLIFSCSFIIFTSCILHIWCLINIRFAMSSW